MNTQEQKTVDKLYALLASMREENNKFRVDVTLQVESLKKQTDTKHLPIYLEQDILKTTQQAIGEAVSKVLTSYDSPLNKLVKSVVEENSSELRQIISSSFTEVISLPEFKQSIVSAFSHKVARTIISNNDGLFDKVSNELKQDAVFKSKMAIAVSSVVEECLKNKISPELS